MIVFVFAATAAQKALCRLWSYCLSPGNFLRPSMLSSGDIRTLWHYARFFQLKKKGLFCPGNSIIIAKEEKMEEKEERKQHSTCMKSPAADSSLSHWDGPSVVCASEPGWESRTSPLEEHPKFLCVSVPCSCSSHSHLRLKSRKVSIDVRVVY